MTESPALPLHEVLALTVAEAGSTVMFGLPGGGPNLDVVGAAAAAGSRFVLAHGETAAAIMASTHGLLTGTPTAVVVTRGPGAASVVNGMAQATLDRYPLVAVTDTVPAATASRVAHQRLDQRSLLAPVSKRSATIADGTGRESLADLLSAATTWPFGAVHLDYDPNGSASPPALERRGLPADPTPSDLAAASALLDRAQRPIVIVGMEAAAIGRPLAELIERFGCPVLTTYQAIGLLDTEGPLHAGLFTNGAIERDVLEPADLIITIGLDLVEPIPETWDYRSPVVRVSSVPQTDDYLPAAVDLVGDVVAITRSLVGEGRRGEWGADAGARFREAGRTRLAAVAAPEPSGFGPLELMAELRARHDHVGTVTVDAGAHFLAVMPYWPATEPFRVLISNGLATMGFAVPAAIGAALARPGEPVLALTGDGGAAMALAELETIARLDLPITVVVFNDSALSLIEIKQGDGHGGDDAVRFGNVDFALIARAVGLDGETVTSREELGRVLGGRSEIDGWSRPRLIDARIDPSPYRHLLSITRG